MINANDIKTVEEENGLKFSHVELENVVGTVMLDDLTIDEYEQLIDSTDSQDYVKQFFYFVFHNEDGKEYALTPNQVDGNEPIDL